MDAVRPRRRAARGHRVARAGATRRAAPSIAGLAVFLDPGHSGSNDASITRQVPNGRGGTKDCQTTGTATADGYPEHSFNWAVVQQIRAALDQLGARTELSRSDDSSVGPCVDQRAAAANAMHPDVIVSIHADGGRRAAGASTSTLEPTTQRGAEWPCSAAGGRHARLADGRGRAGVDVRRVKRTVRSRRPCRLEPGSVPGDSGGARQHEERRRRPVMESGDGRPPYAAGAVTQGMSGI